jgi:hypothetical protein
MFDLMRELSRIRFITVGSKATTADDLAIEGRPTLRELIDSQKGWFYRRRIYSYLLRMTEKEKLLLCGTGFLTAGGMFIRHDNSIACGVYSHKVYMYHRAEDDPFIENGEFTYEYSKKTFSSGDFSNLEIIETLVKRYNRKLSDDIEYQKHMDRLKDFANGGNCER